MANFSALIISLLSFQVANAQLFQDSFENGFGSWQQTCPCSDPMLSNDTPGGTGTSSLDVVAESSSDANCLCVVTYDLLQGIGWLPPGPMTLSYWSKGHDGFGPPATVKVAYRSNGGAPSLTSAWGVGNYDTVWTYQQEDFYWDGVFPSPDSLILLIAAGAADDGPHHAFFDLVTIDGISTGIAAPGGYAPHFRPNPATDKLWVDLPEAPVSLTLIDAAGRTLDATNFTHQERTLQLDVSNASPGLNTLLIRTSSGIRTLRFIKQ